MYAVLKKCKSNESKGKFPIVSGDTASVDTSLGMDCILVFPSTVLVSPVSCPHGCAGYEVNAPRGRSPVALSEENLNKG